MGLFSTKKVITVNTTITRVIANDVLPNTVRSAVLRSLIKGGDVGDYLIGGLVQSLGIRTERMFDYASKHYTNGLPSGSFKTSTDGIPEVEAVIGALEGIPVITEYVKFGPLNPYHLAWTKLVNEFGYDPETNIVNSLTVGANKFYIQDIVLTVPSALTANYLDDESSYWDTPLEVRDIPGRKPKASNYEEIFKSPKVTVNPTISVINITVYCVTNISSSIYSFPSAKTSFAFTLADLDTNADYFQAKYVVGGITKYWQYLLNSGTEPTLDNVFNSPIVENGSFFPFTYFRYNNVKASTNSTNPAFTSSKKMLKYLNMDYEKLITNINENPDIGSVQQAMLMFAVPGNTTKAHEQRYLFDFFSSIYTADVATLDADPTRKLGTDNASKLTIVIQDNKFKMSVSATNITRKVKRGNIGTYASSFVMTYANQEYEQWGDNGIEVLSQSVPVPIHRYQKQITPDFYEEIEVINLKTTFWVFGEYTTIGNETSAILMIPLDHSITEQYSSMDRELLYASSLHFIFNSMQIQKIKWYQSGLFSFLMIIVAIAIVIVSWGTQVQWLGAALAAGEYAIAMEIITILLEELLVGLLINELVTLFVKAIGVDAAFIVAVIAAAYGAYTKFSTVSMQQSVWGEKLLTVATGLIKSAQTVTNSLLEDLIAQKSEFDLYVEDALKTLDDAKNLLFTDHVLSPLDLIPEMSPGQYFDLRGRSNNIGVSIGIRSTTHYVENALTLPKFTDTIGGKRYG